MLGAQLEASLLTELRLPLTAKAANRDYLSYFRPAAPDPLSIALSFQLPPPIFQDAVNRTLTKEILSQDAQGRVLVSRDAAGAVRPQRDERSKIRAVRRDQILNPGILAAKPAS